MKLRWNGRTGAAENARARLPELVREYFEAGRATAGSDGVSAADLHAFRLATKRLRYTLELFRPCYGRELEARLNELRPIQQYLGNANDCAATLRQIPRLFARASVARRKAEEFLTAQLESDTARFLKQWRGEFDAPGRERAWIELLAARERRRRRAKPEQ